MAAPKKDEVRESRHTRILPSVSAKIDVVVKTSTDELGDKTYRSFSAWMEAAAIEKLERDTTTKKAGK